ncbi:unnamed protein product [Brassicogethes aeneus]|uniref:Uncharacterized protein n=1 Tax=Brassicogethes aeneus TaxID=1431903 RepID=A0A9P0B5X5_BRAAE|nr:unnamed protein product [Brassicogethes aeneus]
MTKSWCTPEYPSVVPEPRSWYHRAYGKRAQLTNCPSTDVKLEKILGLRPPKSSHPLVLYQEKNHSNPITIECINRCIKNDECLSFIVYYNVSSCFWLKSSTDGEQEAETEVDTDVDWFAKVCLTVKDPCKNLWTFERIPGAILIGNDTKKIGKPISRTECQQSCLNETEFSCKSAKFRIKKANYGPNAQTLGLCTLSNTDRHLMPNSYRVSSFYEEYFENQCGVDESKPDLSQFCAYEEYINSTLSHSDAYYESKTKEECEDLCEKSTQFHCRGYSLMKTKSRVDRFHCNLHSEDTKIHGPKLLDQIPGGTYFEKARCINISVQCSETYMTIKYNPETEFQGRIYMQGYSENPECFASGEGKGTMVTLKLQLLTKQCGIIKANGMGNRTLLAGTMVLQYNSLIQTQGDRLIKVGCIFGNESKILVGTGVTISSSLPSKGSVIVNSVTNGTTNPTVEMRVVDLNSHKEVSDTQIGQELQLVIEARVSEPMDIWASHLVAMTEKSDESIFLLDDRGCPTDLALFPGLEKIKTNNTVTLVGTFQAFKFASSSILRFSVIVQFCTEKCMPVDCGNGLRSFGRKKRDYVVHRLQTINGTAIVKMNRPVFQGTASVINQMPLEFVMVVRDPATKSDRLIYGENKILVAGYDYVNNEFCLDYSLVIGLIVTWVIVQILFVTCCIILVRKYKRHYEHECTRQSLEELHKNFGIGFSNLENRRVHWADNEEFT